MRRLSKNRVCTKALSVQAQGRRAMKQRRSVTGSEPGQSGIDRSHAKTQTCRSGCPGVSHHDYCAVHFERSRARSPESAAGVPAERPIGGTAAIGPMSGCGLTGRGNSTTKGRCSALANVKLVPGATSGRTNIGFVLLSALIAAAGAASCGCRKLKYHPAMKRGGASRTPLLTASCGQISRKLRLIGPIGTIVCRLHSSAEVPPPNRSEAQT
jgi:hypothetical protein